MYSRNSQYKSAIEYYKEPVTKVIEYSEYKVPGVNIPHVKENFENVLPKDKTIQQTANPKSSKKINMKWETKSYTNTSDPSVWGPSFWFTLHNGASKYPESASPITQSRMKGYILGLPYMLPCPTCQVHASTHIQKLQDENKLDDIVSCKDNLFNFFVDFHNFVNKRYNKTEMSYKDAHKIYSSGANVSRMVYEH